MDLDALIRLAGALGGDEAAVRLAAEDPDAYRAGFAEELRLRGIRPRDAVPGLPWLALVDGLIRYRRLLTVDWRDDLDVIRDGFGTVRPRPAARVWRRVVAAAEDGSAEEVLGALARALDGTGLVLVRVEDPGDMFCVLLLPDADLPEVERLAGAAGYGTVRPWPTEEPEWEEDEEEEPDEIPGTWAKYLAHFGYYGTDGFLLDVVRDPALLEPAREALGTAPPRDRRLVEAVGALLGPDPAGAVAEVADPDLVLDAVLHLHFAPGLERHVFAVVLTAMDRYGLPDKRVARTRALIRAVRFRNKADRARPAFLALAAGQQDRIRAVVHQQLASRDAASLCAALQAACVVGNAETLALATALAGHPVPGPAAEAQGTVAFLSRTS